METMQSMTDHVGDPQNIEGIVAGHASISQLLGNAQTPEQFHAAAVGEIHLGVPRGFEIPLNQHGADPVSRQIQGESHAHGPAPRNQNGGFDCLVHLRSILPMRRADYASCACCHASCMQSIWSAYGYCVKRICLVAPGRAQPGWLQSGDAGARKPH